jgi:hypothetical protein
MLSKINQNKVGWFLVILNYYNSFTSPNEFWAAVSFWLSIFISYDLIVVRGWFQDKQPAK